MLIVCVNCESVWHNLGAKKALKALEATRLFLLEIRSLTLLRIKIIVLMFRTNFFVHIFVGFPRIRLILVPKFSLWFEHFAYVNIEINQHTPRKQYDKKILEPKFLRGTSHPWLTV